MVAVMFSCPLVSWGFTPFAPLVPGGGEALHLAQQLGLQLCFGGQVQFVAAGENLLCLRLAQRVAHHRVVLVGAEDQSEGGIVAGREPFAVIVIDVERKLADLTNLASELREVIGKCGCGSVADCRIIEALSPLGEPA